MFAFIADLLQSSRSSQGKKQTSGGLALQTTVNYITLYLLEKTKKEKK